MEREDLRHGGSFGCKSQSNSCGSFSSVSPAPPPNHQQTPKSAEVVLSPVQNVDFSPIVFNLSAEDEEHESGDSGRNTSTFQSMTNSDQTVSVSLDEMYDFDSLNRADSISGVATEL